MTNAVKPHKLKPSSEMTPARSALTSDNRAMTTANFQVHVRETAIFIFECLLRDFLIITPAYVLED